VTSDERRASLADDAAAWIPPWARTPEPRPAEAEAGEGPPAGEAGGEGLPAGEAAGEGPPGGEAGGEDRPAAEPAADETPVDQPLEEQPPVTETPENEVPAGETPDREVPPVPAEADPGAPVDVPASETPEPTEPEVPSPDAEVPHVGTQAGEVPSPDAGAGEAPSPEPGPPDAASPETGAAEAVSPKAGAAEAVSPKAGAAEAVSPEAEPAAVDDDTLRGALEAILLVVDQPVTEVVLAQVLEQPTDRVLAALDRIAASYTDAGHGFELRRAGGGWRLYTRPEYAAYVEKYVLDGQSVRLTQAALETLAVVAYKQPVTRSRISAIRGVNSDGVIRTLVSRGLVEECGTEPETGAFLYRTTTLFLEKLGLDSVDQLPPLAPFLPDDIEGLADAER
jgi:segregation and condensation protein B